MKSFPPKSIAEVRTFLGCTGFFRSFVKDYGKIAFPLTQKTVKENAIKPFKWTSEDQAAFDELKNRLIHPPIRGYANFQLPFRISCDASGVGLGHVLSQIQDGKEVVICYGGRQLKPKERLMPAIEREALANIDALKAYKYYINQISVEFLSDHKPLVWLAGFKNEDSRLGRWSMKLSPYDY